MYRVANKMLDQRSVTGVPLYLHFDKSSPTFGMAAWAVN